MKLMKPRGLTLLELIVVLVVVFAVALACGPWMTHARESARRQTCAQQMSALQKAITMYEVDYEMYPTIAKGSLGYTERPQDALNLLYRQYVDDVRIFKCPSTGPIVIRNVKPSSDPSFPGGLVSSYGYSPGHITSNSRVIILADKKGVGVNSDNHGKNAGQNVLTSGGITTWLPALAGGASPTNDLIGEKKDSSLPREIIDPDIYTYGDLKAYPDWDSGCQ